MGARPGYNHVRPQSAHRRGGGNHSALSTCLLDRPRRRSGTCQTKAMAGGSSQDTLPCQVHLSCVVWITISESIPAGQKFLLTCCPTSNPLSTPSHDCSDICA